MVLYYFFFFNDTATTEIYTLSLHDALPISVPDDVVDRRDAVGLGLRPARRLPLAHLAGRGIETTQIPAREVAVPHDVVARSEEHTSELQSRSDLVCRLLLEKKKIYTNNIAT